MSDKNKLRIELNNRKIKLNFNKTNLLDLFSQPLNAINIFLTLNSIKPVSRLELSEEEINKLKSFCIQENLHFCKSEFSFQNPKKFFVYFSKDKEKTLQAKEIESNQNDQKFGQLLGYPSCCTKFYTENYELASRIFNRDHSLITIKNSQNTTNIPFQLNYFLRFFGILLIDFYPCSFQCKEAMNLSKKYFELIQKSNPEFANFIKEKLSTFIYYDNQTGVHIFEKKISKLTKHEFNKFTYENVLLTSQNKDYEIFSKGNTIQISKNTCNKLTLFILNDFKPIGQKDFFGFLNFN
ncbi:DUF483 domain-containing protein [Candidatus Woesearchaeota archaeon]|jgi:hypothetical protein|nr:DUF483 domain-containing protein [Candidatus Woesearchaeota archaeon]